MILKTKICRLCGSSYVPDPYCADGYCKECSKFHISRIKHRDRAKKHRNTPKSKKNEN